MFRVVIEILNILIGFYTLYVTYKRFMQGNEYDKFDREFFRRNNKLSPADTIMFVFGFAGVYDLISSMFFSDNPFSRMCGMITGAEFLASAAIIYYVTRMQ